MGIRHVIGGALLATGAAVIGHAAIRTSDGAEVDRELFGLANQGHGDTADAVFGGVTEMGSIAAPLAASAILAASGHRRAAANGAAAACVSWLTLQGIKKLVGRPRPGDAAPTTTRMRIARPQASAWPSSHPAILTTFSRVASRELGVGRGGRALLGVLDLAVAYSRVYVGVHYPSDVASGLLIGRAIARWWPRRRR